MRRIHSLIAATAIAGFAVPASAADPASHNTTRSNKASGIVQRDDGRSLEMASSNSADRLDSEPKDKYIIERSQR
ncbi:MAG: hypothetical protein KDE63_01995 [Novosphingobium sp.]|nr:hypothetical protein [Novosphingobium sp.]